jgi:pimeloyl-ACP methyl ester carboxylesterase
VELSYDRSGTGDPLVLLHGIGMQWQAWKPLLPDLILEREVWAVDLPGFGASPTLPAGVTPDQAAITDAVAGFLDLHGIERPAIGGLSLGGWVALELAKRGRARSVVAISPGGFGDRWLERNWAKLLLWANVHGARRLPRPMLESLAKRPRGRWLTHSSMLAHPDRVPGEDAVALLHAFAESPGFDATLAALTEPFSGGELIDVPVTIAWGTRDQLLWPSQARRAVEQIPGARHVPLPKAGHVPMWEQSELLVRLLLDA